MAWLAIVVGVVPIVVAVVRAVVDGWVPLGDNAYFTVRSIDVFGPVHPLVGAWSAGSSAVGTSVNNLGPLHLDLLAPFTKVTPWAGTAIGVGALNAASVVGIGLVARRLGGPALVLLAMVATSLLTWTMGSELLLESRQHHALLVPFLAFLVTSWGLASGLAWCLPWAVVLASIITQTHFSYLVIVPVVGVWAVAAASLAIRQRSNGTSNMWSQVKGPVVVSVLVGALCWSQTVIDQLWETGNLGRVRAAAGEEPGPGLGTGTRIVVSIVAAPVRWLRAGFRQFEPASAVVRGVTVLLSLLTVGVLAAVLLVARRRGDRTAIAALGTATAAIIAGIFTASRMPAGTFGLVSSNYRWLWPVSVFLALALATGTLGTTDGASGRTRRPVVLMAGVALVVLAFANLPASHQAQVVANDHQDVAESLLAQLDDADLAGPVLVQRRDVFFGEPYTYVVLAALQERGTAFTFADDVDIARFGEARADDGRAERVLIITTGPAARRGVTGAEQIALAGGLGAGSRAELRVLRRELVTELVDGELDVTSAGRQAAASGSYPNYADRGSGGTVERELADELRSMFDAGHLAPTDGQQDDLVRWIELTDRQVNDTVGLFVAPAP